MLFKRIGRLYVAALIGLIGFAGTLRCQTPSGIPELIHSGSKYELLVNGKPFIMLGGQCFNASSSTVESMAPVWRSAVAMHANTVEAPVYWNLLEPRPGQFDFRQVDDLIEGARRRHLHLVLLWFGTWKNGVMYYTPTWIKDNPTKYFHAVGARESISTFCTAARDADAEAYAALLKHVQSVDHTHTVIMMQVENETGIVSAERDHCAQANNAYESAVPARLMDYLEAHRGHLMPALESAWKSERYRRSGTWPEVFGSLAPEAFSAWHVARYVNYVAAAGKRVYPLPTYVNDALKNPGDARPGDYNSGGPTVRVLDIWKAAAPDINLLAPDIYFANFLKTAAAYRRPDNPLFVPETGFAPFYIPYVYAVLARFNGIGFSPYGMDDGVVDGKLTPAGAALAETYATLRPLLPLIEKYQYTNHLFAIVQNNHLMLLPFGGPNSRWRAQVISVGHGLAAVARFNAPRKPGMEPQRAGGLIIQLAPDRYVVAGSGFRILFRELQGPPRDAIFASVEAGTFKDGKWVMTRYVNSGQSSTNSVQLGSFVPGRPATHIVRIRLMPSTISDH